MSLADVLQCPSDLSPALHRPMASQAELLTSPTITRKKGLWEMRKEELLTEAAARDLPVNTRLTVPELRELIKKDMNAQAMPFTARQGTSLSKLSVEALKQKVIESGQELPVKPTRGALLLLLRDRGDTVIRFGRHRGLMYNQTPISYREWACTEARTSSTASNDLKDFAAWWAETKEEMEIRPSSSTMRNRGGYHDPEVGAAVPYIPDETSRGSWSLLGNLETPPRGIQPKTRARRSAPSESGMSRGSMDQDLDPDVLDEVQHLEERLAILRDRHGLPPRGSPGRE